MSDNRTRLSVLTMIDNKRGQTMNTEQFTYHINLNERGSFLADVRDSNGKTVYAIKAGDELGPDESSIFEDGYMDHPEDICNLAEYLKDLNIMPHNSNLSFG